MGNHFLPIRSFTNYIDAHILLGKLESEGITCFLKDENTATVMPIWTQALGGIRLMVAEDQMEKARKLVEEFQQERKEKLTCPHCGSHNIEYVTTPRKPGNWLGVLLGFFFISYPVTVEKVYHCFTCGHEFDPPVE